MHFCLSPGCCLTNPAVQPARVVRSSSRLTSTDTHSWPPKGNTALHLLLRHFQPLHIDCIRGGWAFFRTVISYCVEFMAYKGHNYVKEYRKVNTKYFILLLLNKLQNQWSLRIVDDVCCCSDYCCPNPSLRWPMIPAPCLLYCRDWTRMAP